ncbi:MAG: site-2 protease family protein [Myxococcales bacterium]|nr:site-2 protease family protein [Myxococcales bacterium]
MRDRHGHRPAQADGVDPPSDAQAEWLQALLWFAATFVCVIVAYQTVWGPGEPAMNPIWFALSFLGILSVHEAGHYVVARWHGFQLSPPLFIPFPMGFGTLGAVIRLRSLPRSRQALLEMGAAGPLAGAALAFLIAIVTVGWAVPGQPPVLGPTAHGPPPFIYAVFYAIGGAPPPWFRPTFAPVEIMVFNDPLILKLAGLLTTGHIPGRYDTYHPATLGAWMGCLLTMTNLVPVGQLDGGHVLNALHPRTAVVRTVTVLAGMAVLGFWWQGWWVFGLVAVLGGAWRPLRVPNAPRLTPRAWGVAALIAAVFVLTFQPVPIETEVVPAGAAP